VLHSGARSRGPVGVHRLGDISNPRTSGRLKDCNLQMLVRQAEA
jgi:hypothetical protein